MKNANIGKELNSSSSILSSSPPVDLVTSSYLTTIQVQAAEIEKLKAEIVQLKINSGNSSSQSSLFQQEVKSESNPYVISTVNSYALDKFLKHVSFGEQKQVEAMLIANNDLAIIPCDFIDCTERHFKQVTALQYAVWVLDWHMWVMILKHIPDPKIVKAQLLKLINEGVDLKEPGASNYAKSKQVSWQNLIDALQTYVNKYATWSYDECSVFWCQDVGGAQLMLPAHVINEYSRDDRSFDPCPSFNNNELELPRCGVSDWIINSNSILGKDFGWCRGSGSLGFASGGGRGRGLLQASCFDRKAMTTLHKVRVEQRDQLISSMTNV